MADFSPLLKRAITALPLNTAAARRDIYERARSALVKQLRNLDPPIDDALIDKELLKLEEAIEGIEAEQVEKTTGLMENELAEALKADLASKPASTLGPEEVKAAAIEASSLGSAVAEAKKSAEASLNAIEPGPMPVPEPPSKALEEFRAPPPLDVPRFDEERIVMPEPLRSSRAKGGSVGIKVVGITLVVLSLIAAALYGYLQLAKQHTAASRPPAPVIAAPAPGKAEDRVQQDSPSSPPAGTQSQPAPAETAAPRNVTQQPAPPPPAVAAAPAAPARPTLPATAQKAVLLEEVPGQQQGLPLAGSVVWRTESVTGTNGQAELALRGDAEIPERRFGVTLIIRPNSDNTLPASHTVEILFRLPRDFPFGGVANVPGLLAKLSEQSRGQPLVGQAVRVTNSFFLIGLSSEPTDVTSNVGSLKDRGFFDVPIMYDNGRRAILTLEKGENGTKAFNDAFAAWKQ